MDHVPERIDGGGYGFGHQVLHDDRFGSIVGHSGGLPGYGSNMRWLPGRRVGAVALANSTYAPMRSLSRRMLEILDDHGLVPPIAPPLTPAFQDAAERLVGLLHDWDDDVAADAVRRQRRPRRVLRPSGRAAAALVDGHGPLTVANLVQTSATAGTISLAGRTAAGRRSS